MVRSLLILCLLGAVAGLWPSVAAPAARPSDEPSATVAQAAARTAPVVVDGRPLFDVIGIPSYPPAQRAKLIGERIDAVAADPGFDVAQLRIQEEPRGSAILAGEKLLMVILDADARNEGLERKILVKVWLEHVSQAVLAYRAERTAEYLRRSAILAAVAIAGAALFLWFTHWSVRRLQAVSEARYRARLEKLETGSFGMLDAEQMASVIERAIRAVWWLIVLFTLLFSVDFVLEQFPWTRHAARWLLALVLDPLRTMGQAIADSIPNLVFIAILILIVRYVLGVLRLFFLGISRGAVRISGFSPEWAMTTFKLVRFGIIAFALVVAYPYIPGSSSAAFQGISVFLGVLFSIGSSSIIANTLAGYALIYRRAFDVGDRVRLGTQVGHVVEMRQQVTTLNTPKNETVVIPNSLILNSEVVNYSTQARENRLILHSTVTIGYDTPWRQVEAMLLLAAERTAGLLKNPGPFVLKTALTDFYVSYEINAYCGDASRIDALYSELHQNILDVFNEHGVQIMSPHFEAQPEQAVVVPKAKWYEAPARRPGEDGTAPAAGTE